MPSDYRKNNMEQDGENEHIFSSWMEDDDDDHDDDNVLVESVKGRVLKFLDDALLTATLTDDALDADEERKPLSPTDFMSEKGSFDFTSPSSPKPNPTQQPSSLAQHTIEKQFQSYGSGKSMQDLGIGMNSEVGARQAASGKAMSAAQSQVMQTMAINAASNAASSAASAASGLTSAASAAAAAAARTAVATTVATVSIIAAVVRSNLYGETFGALVFGSLAHLSLPFVAYYVDGYCRCCRIGYL
jgi:hypothetical protein